MKLNMTPTDKIIFCAGVFFVILALVGCATHPKNDPWTEYHYRL